MTADNVIDGEEFDKNGKLIKSDTQGWNRYSYCKDNPIIYKDPSGHDIGIYVDENRAPTINKNWLPNFAKINNGHLSLFFQDGNGQWYSFESGPNAKPDGSSYTFEEMKVGVPAYVGVQPIDKEDIPEGTVIIKATKEQDNIITKQIKSEIKKYKNGEKLYKVLENSCLHIGLTAINESNQLSGKIPLHKKDDKSMNTLQEKRPNSWKKFFNKWLDKSGMEHYVKTQGYSGEGSNGGGGGGL